MMKLRCKVDDTAWISNGASYDYGKFVRVLRVAVPGDVVEWEPGAWFVESLGSPIATFTAAGTVVPKAQRAIRDCDLTPLRPGAEDAVDVRDVLLGQRAAA